MADLTTFEQLKTETALRSVRYFVGARDEHTYDDADTGLLLDPPYQRSSVWTLDQRRRLMRSLLLRLPVPALVVNDRFAAGFLGSTGKPDDYRTVVVDGKQRIETMLAWVDGHLELPADWFAAEYIESTRTGADGTTLVTSHDLTATGARLTTALMNIPVCVTFLPTLREEAALYLLLNTGGTQHSDDDLAVARDLTDD